MKKKWVAFMTAVCLAAVPVGVLAEETDYSYLEDMSVKELKELDAAIHNLLGDGGVVQEEELVTESEQKTEESVFKTTEEFLSDFKSSYDKRETVSKRYTEAERYSMTSEEWNEHLADCAEAERDFYENYKNAVFDDLNIQYLCNQYIQGLGKQYSAVIEWQDDPDNEHASSVWQSGYYNRAYVMVELSEYYGLDLPSDTVASMKEDTDAMDSLNEAETRNAAVDHSKVQKVQELLNQIGFFCGNADGISGKRTVKSIKRFQEMYGYDPIDGMIDDELIEQLETIAAEKEPIEEEIETESEE